MNNTPSFSRIEQKATQLWQKYLAQNHPEEPTSTNHRFWKDYDKLIQEATRQIETKSVLRPVIQPQAAVTPKVSPVGSPNVYFRNRLKKGILLIPVIFALVTIFLWIMALNGKVGGDWKSDMKFSTTCFAAISLFMILFNFFTRLKITVSARYLQLGREKAYWDDITKVVIVPISGYSPLIRIKTKNYHTQEHILRLGSTQRHQLINLLAQNLGQRFIQEQTPLAFDKKYMHM
ncbi:hypothetical protein BKI52_21190 [marine bacterium AO1-C]|nr:hypothetical protein BKI52_21190 [marine bacterium AO1-C]